MERYLILVSQTDTQTDTQTHTYLNAGVALGQVGIRAGACWALLGLQVGARPRLTENILYESARPKIIKSKIEGTFFSQT